MSRFRSLANAINRIVDNAHLLDATEIFRKLNVHKKVGKPNAGYPSATGVLVLI